MPATVLIIVNAINRISGNIDERYSYSPFGETTILDDVFNPKLNNDRTINAEYTYTGRRLDPETGLVAPLLNDIRSVSQDDVDVIGEDRISEHIDAKYGGELREH